MKVLESKTEIRSIKFPVHDISRELDRGKLSGHNWPKNTLFTTRTMTHEERMKTLCSTRNVFALNVFGETWEKVV